MKKISFNQYIAFFLLASGVMMLFASCEKEETFEKTRLFPPCIERGIDVGTQYHYCQYGQY